MPQNQTNEKSKLVQDAVKQQTISWTNMEQVLSYHMASLGHNMSILKAWS